MHFSHSYKWLGKCTFLKLCTMHFCTARTIVHWTVTACMEARNFLKTTALTTLGEVHLESKVLPQPAHESDSAKMQVLRGYPFSKNAGNMLVWRSRLVFETPP